MHHPSLRVSRRDWLRATAIGVTGFSASGWLDVLAARAADQARAKYRSCILLWLSGGPSHVDTWDVKPEAPAESRTPFKPIATAVPGVQICELLPKLAQRMKHLAIVRGMSTSNQHEVGTGDMHGAGLFQQPGVARAGLGSAVSALHGLDGFGMPTHIVIGKRSQFDARIPGPGFLGPRHAAMIVPTPGSPIDNLAPAVEANEFQERLALLDELQQGFRQQHRLNMVGSHAAGYQSAVGFMRSSKAKAFDLGQESDKVRDAYGKNQFGNGCLLARRLVEVGLPFVEVKWLAPVSPGDTADVLLPWDTHKHPVQPYQVGLPLLDAAFSALLDELKDRGLLDSTLIVCMGEFGRTPRLERRGGRDHYGKAWSLVLAGGGIKGGQVVGATDKEGATVTDRPTSAADLLATVCLALGVDPVTEFGSRDGKRLDGSRSAAAQMAAAGAPVRLLPAKYNPLKELLA